MKIDVGSKVMLDTNVLIEATDQNRVFHTIASDLFRNAWNAGVSLFISTQSLREYLVVATRPVEKNGLGLSLNKSLFNVQTFRNHTSLLPESVRASEVLLELAEHHRISGLRLHDLQILATADANGVNYLITANDKDFPKTSRVHIVTLKSVVL